MAASGAYFPRRHLTAEFALTPFDGADDRSQPDYLFDYAQYRSPHGAAGVGCHADCQWPPGNPGKGRERRLFRPLGDGF